MIFSRLTPVAVSAYALQAGLACIFVPKAEDRFYDLSGAAGFLSTTLVSIYYPYIRSQGKITPSTFLQLSRLAPRQALLSAALVIWSLRLGSFLAQRAIKAGGDSRFDEIKKDKIKFTGAWMAQATWIFVVGLPVYIVTMFLPLGCAFLTFHNSQTYCQHQLTLVYMPPILFPLL